MDKDINSYTLTPAQGINLISANLFIVLKGTEKISQYNINRIRQVSLKTNLTEHYSMLTLTCSFLYHRPLESNPTIPKHYYYELNPNINFIKGILLLKSYKLEKQIVQDIITLLSIQK